MKYVIATIIAVCLSLAFSLTLNPSPVVSFFVGMVLGCGAILAAAAIGD